LGQGGKRKSVGTIKKKTGLRRKKRGSQWIVVGGTAAGREGEVVAGYQKRLKRLGEKK